MKNMIRLLIGLMLSCSLLGAQEKPLQKVCLTPSSKGNARVVATQKYIPERRSYLVEVHTMVCNMTSKPRKAAVTVKVRDARGKLINNRKESVKLTAASAREYGIALPIDKPHFKDETGKPYKYKVSVSVGKDVWESDFVFREQ